jgi:phosphoenolpyruvate carboxylase
MSSSGNLQQFRNEVGIKFQLYNSLFTSLPFHRIEKTGILLSLLQNNCEEGFKKKQSPVQIIEDFFARHTSYTTAQEKTDLLFRFVQYVERQVVLFDALEDAAFKQVNDMAGVGSLKHLESEILQEQKQDALAEKLKDFSVRLVLTAHPTQFYPGTVLGIINDLSKSLSEDNAAQVNMYLQQLGKTPFFKKQKPTPFDEAISLVWYLENVFYPAAGRITGFMKSRFPDAMNADNPILKMGFWPGGDRDGNPFVTTGITLKVAEALRGSIIKCYYLDVRKLRRRLTFSGVDTVLTDLEQQLYNNLFVPGQRTNITKADILKQLHQIKETIIYQHNGLFLSLVENLINKVELFGLHFASLDVRQDSSVHTQLFEALAAANEVIPTTYTTMNDADKLTLLGNINDIADVMVLSNEVHKDTFKVVSDIKIIQQYNGESGLNRYIISQCNSAVNAMEVLALFSLAGWKKEEINVDIVPLFETIEDLQHAAAVMETLYTHPVYIEHLQRRKNRQTIMLGFSDGTKDGGYLMANWGIYKAKEELSMISRQYNVDVVFFDGRGGPPARGGGKTHKFYASLGKNIANKEIQLTVQGQTVSSNFGTIDAAQFNMEQLLHAGISNDVFVSNKSKTLTEAEEQLMQQLSVESFKTYSALKEHPYFIEYLGHASPLRFYAETNIGSRPAKRGAAGRLSLKDLRAIPFVGAWSQLKQNVTGYYGVGSALKALDQQGKFDALKELYKNSLFFKTLMDNCEMAMMKCYFPLTAFLSEHPKYGEIWYDIFNEYELTKKYIFLLSGKHELMADYPVEQLSINMREKIVLPLLTIQQYAITKVREIEEQIIDTPLKSAYEKLVMRCSFGIINAGRNSA